MNYTPPAQIAAFLACVFVLVALFNQVANLWYRIRGKPTPAEMASASATLSERIGRIETCTISCKLEQDRRLDALERSQISARETLYEELGNLHDKVNAVATAVGTMTGTLESIQGNVNTLLSRGPRK